MHHALRDLVIAGCERVRAATGVATVALSGGVFANALLLALADDALHARGFRVLLHREVPCNDGGDFSGVLSTATSLPNNGTPYAPAV